MPVKVNAELRSYQQDGVNWLAFLRKYELHGILCDDMGLGKTLQSICIVAAHHHIVQSSVEGDKFAPPISLVVVIRRMAIFLVVTLSSLAGVPHYGGRPLAR